MSRDSDRTNPTPQIRLEPINDPPAKRESFDDLIAPQNDPLVLGPPVPLEEDPVLKEAERVPNSTNYLCANCNYILAGLTSRRCPECGEPFTISSARIAGLDATDEMKGLHAAVRRESIKYFLGIFLIVAGFMIPNVVGGVSIRGGPLSLRGLIMLAFIIPVLGFAAYFRTQSEARWCNVMLTAGIIVISVGIVVAVI